LTPGFCLPMSISSTGSFYSELKFAIVSKVYRHLSSLSRRTTVRL